LDHFTAVQITTRTSTDKKATEQSLTFAKITLKISYEKQLGHRSLPQYKGPPPWPSSLVTGTKPLRTGKKKSATLSPSRGLLLEVEPSWPATILVPLRVLSQKQRHHRFRAAIELVHQLQFNLDSHRHHSDMGRNTRAA
jgi:hypothetical protein